jgi:hypothetical protein
MCCLAGVHSTYFLFFSKGALVDAVVAIDMSSGLVVPTKDGASFFSHFQHLGTTSTDLSDGIFNIQFHATSDIDDETSQQYHQNGLT